MSNQPSFVTNDQPQVPKVLVINDNNRMEVVKPNNLQNTVQLSPPEEDPKQRKKEMSLGGKLILWGSVGVIILLVIAFIIITVMVFNSRSLIRAQIANLKVKKKYGTEKIEKSIESSTEDTRHHEVMYINYGPEYCFSSGEAAEKACTDLYSTLATEEQIKNAMSKGARWCGYGWFLSSDDGYKQGYPMQPEFSNNCEGKHGLVLAEENMKKSGAMCYGPKPPKERSYGIAPFNPLQWSEEKKKVSFS